MQQDLIERLARARGEVADIAGSSDMTLAIARKKADRIYTETAPPEEQKSRAQLARDIMRQLTEGPQEDLIFRLAQEADYDLEEVVVWERYLRRFAALVAEEAAKTCDAQVHNCEVITTSRGQSCAARAAAKSIRAMFKEPPRG